MKLYWSPRSPFVRKVMVCARSPRAAKWFETFNARPSMQSTLPHEEQ